MHEQPPMGGTLTHSGVKGMKWGIRKDRGNGGGGNRTGGGGSAGDGLTISPNAKKAAKIAGVATLAVGGSFVAYKLSQSGGTPVSSITKIDTGWIKDQMAKNPPGSDPISKAASRAGLSGTMPRSPGPSKFAQDHLRKIDADIASRWNVKKGSTFGDLLNSTKVSDVRAQARAAPKPARPQRASKPDMAKYGRFNRDVKNLGLRFPNLQGAELKKAIDDLGKSHGL